MQPLAIATDFKRQLQQVWRLRYLVVSLVSIDLQARYRHSILGVGWCLLRPMAMSALFCFIFAGIFNQPLKEFAPFLMLGLTVWQFLTESILFGCTTYSNASGYLRQQAIPLSIMPLRTVLGVGFHALIALTLATLVSWGFRGLTLTAIPSLIPGVILLFLLGWALAMAVGIVTTYFRDIQHFTEIGLQMLFYLSPILYSPAMFKGRPGLLACLNYNPVTYLLDVVRVPVLDGHLASPQSYLVSLLSLCVVGSIAVLSLYRVGRKIVFWL